MSILIARKCSNVVSSYSERLNTWVKPAPGEEELVFSGLTPGQEYQVMSRRPETDTKNASEPVVSAAVTTPEEIERIEPQPEESAPSGDWALMNLILALSTIGLAVYTLLKKRDEEDKLAKRNKTLRLIGLIPALASAVTFLLTQKMTEPMVIADRWTALMAGYLALFGVVTALTRSKKTDKV